MNRRQALALGASAALTSLSPRNARAASVCERTVARVGRNHGHVFVVELADVKVGIEKTYDLTGTAEHPHAITLGPEEFRRLRSGEILRAVSTREEGHAHRLLVRCGPLKDPPEAVSVCDVVVSGKDDHEFVINAADMARKVERAYDIQGVAGHTHSVVITAAHFEALARGEQVTPRSTPAEGHTHVAFVRHLAAKR